MDNIRNIPNRINIKNLKNFLGPKILITITIVIPISKAPPSAHAPCPGRKIYLLILSTERFFCLHFFNGTLATTLFHGTSFEHRKIFLLTHFQWHFGNYTFFMALHGTLTNTLFSWHFGFRFPFESTATFLLIIGTFTRSIGLFSCFTEF